MVKMTKEEFMESYAADDVNKDTWRAELLKKTMSGEPVGPFPKREQLKRLMEAIRRPVHDVKEQIKQKAGLKSFGMFGGDKKSKLPSPSSTPTPTKKR